MKVLWLTSKDPLVNHSSGGGWFSSLCQSLRALNEYEFYFCFPGKRDEESDNTFIFKSRQKNSSKINKKVVKRFEKLLEVICPDVIHVWGTENTFSFALVKAAKKLGYVNKIVVHIQGFCFACAEQYEYGLPFNVIHGVLPRDLYLGNVRSTKKQFEKRGRYEKELLLNVSHVFGRTTWDYAYCKAINPNLNYHYCGELLRDSFYHKEWAYKKCNPRSVFVSSASYPLKGLHYCVLAFAEVVKQYPDAKLLVGGTSVVKSVGGFKERIKLSRYGLYIKRLIRKYNLTQNIVFLGPLNEKQICSQYLQSNVYLLCSSLENSSNSLGEAMTLGVPTIASYVGGNPDFIRHGENGYLYPFSDFRLLAFYIIKIFEMKEEAERLSVSSRKSSFERYEKEKILCEIIKVYGELAHK